MHNPDRTEAEASEKAPRGRPRHACKTRRLPTMDEDHDPSRREFLSTTGKLVVGEALLSAPAGSSMRTPDNLAAAALPPVPKSRQAITEFHYGASVYPELQTRAEWNSMLDHFQRAQMNCV